MPRGERARLWLRGLLKLAGVVLAAAAGGMALGAGISQLTGDDDARSDRTEASTETAETTTGSREQVRVTVGSAVLHPARTPSGRRRNRARLGVRVTVVNRGAQRVVLPRPSLLAARQRIPTNAAADAPGTRLGAVGGGETVKATLQFETAGAVTEQLTTQKRARVLVAGRSWPVTVTIGPPVS